MKTPARFLCRRFTFLIVVAGMALLSLASAFAQKPDPVSPNEPKVTICHRTHGVSSFTITVAQSAVPAHLAHGDTLGGCPGEGSYVVCHRGSTITVTESVLASHLAHGDTLGPCSSFAGSAVKIASPAGGAPIAIAPATIPAPVVPAHVVQEDVAICYKGQSVLVSSAVVQTYLSIGATMGRCPEKAEAAESSGSKEKEAPTGQK